MGQAGTRVTLQTVADRVGVSRMTVSNAFSRPDQLSAGLRQRILSAADELGYSGPDPSGRALARGSTAAVGVLLTESVGEAFSDPVAARFFGALAERLAPTGLAVTLVPATGTAEKTAARDVGIDGALVYSCARDTPALQWLLKRRLPLVYVDQDPVGDAATVHMDDRGGARAAAEHLLSLGHRRVGLLTLGPGPGAGPSTTPEWNPEGHVGRERVLGWLDGLRQVSAEVSVAHVAAHTEAAAAAAAATLLSRPARPTALLCFSDLVAGGAVDAARDLGLRVPVDVSIVGFDDSPLAAWRSPPLTTVRQDLVAKGYAAADVLVGALAGQPAEHRLLPVELVVRESTAPPG